MTDCRVHTPNIAPTNPEDTPLWVSVAALCSGFLYVCALVTQGLGMEYLLTGFWQLVFVSVSLFYARHQRRFDEYNPNNAELRRIRREIEVTDFWKDPCRDVALQFRAIKLRAPHMVMVAIPAILMLVCAWFQI